MRAPILKGERLVLRPVRIKDAPNYVRWFRDRKVMRYFNQAIWCISLEKEKTAIRKLQRSKTDMTWAIEVDGKHIGGTGLKLEKDLKSARWGIIIGEKDYWGQGCAIECARLCVEYAFKKLKYERVDLIVETGNERAIRSYKKAGFKLEGTMRSIGVNKLLRKRIDQHIMSILKNEWKN